MSISPEHQAAIEVIHDVLGVTGIEVVDVLGWPACAKCGADNYARYGDNGHPWCLECRP
jgi:hypothetical protein